MKSSARAPSNIAFVKYWGKLPAQNDQERNMACNSSLSMTLSRTVTTAHVEEAAEWSILINQSPASPKDFAKVKAHAERVAEYYARPLPPLRIQSDNNFPQGTGMASSASSFAALTLALSAHLRGAGATQSDLKEDASELSALARRGSGSACRSLAGPFTKWDGPAARRIPVEWKLFDTVVVFSNEHKKVPSSEAHDRIQASPLFQPRLAALPARSRAIEAALLARKLSALGPWLEEEALNIHAVARACPEPIDYLLPETKRFLEAIQALPTRDFYFTLDAGPNVHIISERPIRAELTTLLAQCGLTAELHEDESGPGASVLPEGPPLR